MRRRNDWHASTLHRSMRGWTNTVASIHAPESPMPPQGSSMSSPRDPESCGARSRRHRRPVKAADRTSRATSTTMRWIVAPVLLAVGTSAVHGVHSLSAQGGHEPQVLYWEQHGQPNTGTAVGLLYTPEVLSALVARISPGTVPRAIADAIRQGTPVVAMWEFSVGPDLPQPQPPYQVAIVDERGGEEVAAQPLWTQQRAGDLAPLDTRLTSTKDRMAAIAAFPASAFVPGRRVRLQSARMRTEVGRVTMHQRWGVIRWDGRLSAR